MSKIDAHPNIYSDSNGSVYIYDYGKTVEVVNWGDRGRKFFYRRQGIEEPWTIVKIINDTVIVESTTSSPPWLFPPCPTLNPNLPWSKKDLPN